MKNTLPVLLSIVIVAILGAIIYLITTISRPQVNPSNMPDETTGTIDEQNETSMPVNDTDQPFVYEYEAMLEDVIGRNLTGTAMAGFDGETYQLLAEFDDLPNPEEFGEGFFYEGWVVRAEPFAFISTGEVELDDNFNGVNFYTSSADYTEYGRYVLTIEPNNGDPAPADHVLEADFVLVK